MIIHERCFRLKRNSPPRCFERRFSSVGVEAFAASPSAGAVEHLAFALELRAIQGVQGIGRALLLAAQDPMRLVMVAWKQTPAWR